ncbi:hypothetical protein D3C80_1518550 [compost metagenome]
MVFVRFELVNHVWLAFGSDAEGYNAVFTFGHLEARDDHLLFGTNALTLIRIPHEWEAPVVDFERHFAVVVRNTDDQVHQGTERDRRHWRIDLDREAFRLTRFRFGLVTEVNLDDRVVVVRIQLHPDHCLASAFLLRGAVQTEFTVVNGFGFAAFLFGLRHVNHLRKDECGFWTFHCPYS